MRAHLLAPLSLGLLTGFGCAAVNYESPDGPRHAELLDAGTLSPPTEVRVATFNIRFGERIEGAARELDALGALDVVLLQEVDATGARSVARALAMSFVYYPASVQHDRDFGNAVLSRWPILEDHKVLLPHRAPFDQRARIAVSARLAGPDGPLFVVSVHNETLLLRSDARLEQAAAILDHTDTAYPGLRGVIAGDFNTVSRSSIEATRSLHEARGFVHVAPSANAATARSAIGEHALDHIFVRGLEALDTGIAPFGVSDHAVVWVALD